MTDQAEIRAALFDLDDTLLDRQSAYNRFYRSFYDRQDAINEDISWPEAREFFWTLSPYNATDPRQAFTAIQARWPGVTGDPESHYLNYFKGIISTMRPLPGVVEFIEALNESGLPWGIVTNGGQHQHEKLRATGLVESVPVVIATELHGASKPDPEPYLHALKLLGLDEGDAPDVIFVGDNPYTDITGAQGLGMRTAWIRMGRGYPHSCEPPSMVIDHVGELADVLGL